VSLKSLTTVAFDKSLVSETKPSCMNGSKVSIMGLEGKLTPELESLGDLIACNVSFTLSQNWEIDLEDVIKPVGLDSF